MNKNWTEDLLILAKTYPSPSSGYTETTCVAAINQQGVMRRIYPVPFRMLQNTQHFKKWQWINARIDKAHNDHRSESHKIYIDTIIQKNELSTKNEWYERKSWISLIPESQQPDTSLYLVKPKSIESLEIVPESSPDWTEEQKEKLTRAQSQMSLFNQEENLQPDTMLRKIPHKFYYHYTIDTPDGETSQRHKIVDWEAGALYWNCIKNHGESWEEPFRKKMAEDLPSKDLMFLLGNIQRFRDQWLIISLIYPPVTIQQMLL